MPPRALFAPHALLPQGWARDVLLQWDAQGRLAAVTPGAEPGGAPQAAGPVLPGMPNVHSHAFQRAFSGLTEQRGSAAQDSFWSWRERMYGFAARITPAQLQAVATWLYVEMLPAGYTSACALPLLHAVADGCPYADDATLAQALLAAAQEAGIGITLLPVLYQASGFGGQAPRADQRRFIRSTDNMLSLLERLALAAQGLQADLGLAPHSLRAVPPNSLRVAVQALHALRPAAPVHIHIAEQLQEVQDCLAWSGQRPVQWLLEHAPVDARWCLVHATHMDEGEYRRAAATGAVAGLCPSTEANLGDGIFDAARWQGHGGAWGVGSDSHACVNAAEELMLLEYSQRLARRERNVLATPAQLSVATAQWLAAVHGGARAAGRPVAGLAAGQLADFVVLDAQHLALQGLAPAQMLDAHVFASHRTSAVAQVWVAGTRRVANGRHALHDRAAHAFTAARHALLHSLD